MLLGDLDRMVQSYLKVLSNRGGVINTIANVTIKQNSDVFGDIDVDSSRWAASLFRRMGFVKRRKALSKVHITDVSRKEIQYTGDSYDKHRSNPTEICTS